MRGLPMSSIRFSVLGVAAFLALALGAVAPVAAQDANEIRPVLSMELEELAARLGSIGALPVQLADDLRPTVTRPPEVVRFDRDTSLTREGIRTLLESRGFQFVVRGEGSWLELTRAPRHPRAITSVRPFDILKTFEPELSTKTLDVPHTDGDVAVWSDATFDFAGGMPMWDFPTIERVFAANHLEFFERVIDGGARVWVLRTLPGHAARTAGPPTRAYVPPLTLVRAVSERVAEPLGRVIATELNEPTLNILFGGVTPVVATGSELKLRAFGGAIDQIRRRANAAQLLPVIRQELRRAGLRLDDGSFADLEGDTIELPPTVEPTVAAAPQEPTTTENASSASATSSEDASTDSDESDPSAIREKVYYVPFEELRDVFEAADRGIFLPYDEFLALWRKAEGRDPDGTEPPPAPTVLRRARYSGEIAHGAARFQAQISVESLTEGWSETRILLQSIALEDVTITSGGEPSDEAMFVASNGAYSLLLPGKGTYDLDLVFSVPIAAQPGKKSIGFGIPTVAVSQLELRLPEEDLRVDVTPQVAATRVESLTGETTVQAFVGDTGSVSVAWLPPAGRAGEEGAIVSASQLALASLSERVLRLDSRVEFSVLRGEVDTFQIALPADFQLISVQADNLKEWRPEDGVLTVSFHAAITGRAVLDLGFERILDGTPPSIAVPFPNVLGVSRTAGTVALEHDPALRVRITDLHEGLTGAAPQCRRQEFVIAFDDEPQRSFETREL